MSPGPFDAWQRAAGAVADAQVALWAAMFEALVSVPARAGVPGAAQAEAAARRATDVQRDLLQSWLASGTGVGPRSHPGRRTDAGDVMLGALREGARQLIDNQAAWARRWNAGSPPPGPFARP